MQILALDAEENVAVRRRGVEHHRRFLPNVESVLIGDDFKVAVAITQLCRRVRRHPHSCLCINRRGAFVGTAPRYAVITFALRREAEFGLALGAGLHGLSEDIVTLVTSEFEPPA